MKNTAPIREDRADEIKRLERCINDLVSVLALPAMWTGSEPSHVLDTLLDALLRMLKLDFAYVRLHRTASSPPVEMVRIAPLRSQALSPTDVCGTLEGFLAPDSSQWPSRACRRIGDLDVSIVPLSLGLQNEIGVVVAGSARTDFPKYTERLILSVAANQACIGLQEARLLSDQRRLASDLDRRVAQRTAELTAANEELTRSEAFLAEAQRLSRTGSFSWRLPSNEVTWSEQLYRIYAFDRRLPVTLDLIRSRVHPQDLQSFDAFVAKAQHSASAFEHEHRLLMPDRTIRYLHVTAHGARDKGGRIEFIGAVHDVTQRRISEEALAHARSELARVSRMTALGALTASIAHEVNQPLAGIMTNAGTCMRMLNAEMPNVQGALETVRRTIRDARRASDVIARLRALFSKKDAEIESIDLNEAVNDVLAATSSDLRRTRVIVRSELAHDLPRVTGDRVQLQQVILNLLRNASEAMSEVDDRPREVTIRTFAGEEDQVRLTVQDAGVGLGPLESERLFQAFYTTKEGGMGVGLAISRSIIESHQGRLWAEANDGPGATFSFSIPRSVDATTHRLALGGLRELAAHDTACAMRNA
jgi:C4-dicarboxylate-specific signal transduction histidine kinase